MPLFKPKKPAVTSKAPVHIAIIMDGNGRWAKSRGLPRSAGHKKGAEAIQEVLNGCRQEQVRYLTLYAFSLENWKRSSDEVDKLMGLLRYYLDRELGRLHEEGVRLRVVGDRSVLAADIIEKITYAETLTAQNELLFLNIALSYGARQEILQATKEIAKDCLDGTIKISDIDDRLFSHYLYTAGIPEPDLLIRTGGEKRVSNFLLWQIAYTELLFVDILWPDFKKADLIEAVTQFKKRERRYGT